MRLLKYCKASIAIINELYLYKKYLHHWLKVIFLYLNIFSNFIYILKLLFAIINKLIFKYLGHEVSNYSSIDLNDIGY